MTMLVSGLEHFLIFSSGLAAAAFVLAWAARRLSGSRRWRPNPHALATFYTCALLIPPVGALWLVMTTLMPAWWLEEASVGAAHPSPMHGLHLLDEVLAPFEPAAAVFALGFTAVAGLVLLVALVRGSRRARGVVSRLPALAGSAERTQMRRLRRLCAHRGLQAIVVPTEYPVCFVWGLRRGTLVVSGGLLRAITGSGLRAVVEHEAAHHARRDNLVHAVLTAFSYASLAAPLSWAIMRWRREQVELVCDEIAAAYTAAPLEVAQALVNVHRRMVDALGLRIAIVPTASALVPEDPSCLETRVRRLLHLADRPPTRSAARAMARGPRRLAIAVTVVFCATVLGLTAFAPLAIHQAAEALIRLIA